MKGYLFSEGYLFTGFYGIVSVLHNVFFFYSATFSHKVPLSLATYCDDLLVRATCLAVHCRLTSLCLLIVKVPNSFVFHGAISRCTTKLDILDNRQDHSQWIQFQDSLRLPAMSVDHFLILVVPSRIKLQKELQAASSHFIVRSLSVWFITDHWGGLLRSTQALIL